MVLRQSMGKLLELFQNEEMARIHRSFAVNPHKVESASASRVIIQGKKLPIGPKHREEFLAWIRELQG
jgi:DNA-binding LytR/AlgR family response regulator